MANTNTMSTKWWQKLSTPQASIIVALIALLPSVATGVATYLNRPTKDEVTNQVRARLSQLVPQRPGYKPYISPRIGLGFTVPLGWRVDDAVHTFGGGEIDLIRHYDLDANSISEGIKFALRVVQGNYVKYPQKEEDNMLDTIRASIDPNVKAERAEINGEVGVRFTYKQKTGQRIGQISRTWVRLHDRVKLEVILFTNLGDERPDFYNEARDIMNSIVLDKQVIAANASQIDR
jgi:hypothetical protein